MCVIFWRLFTVTFRGSSKTLLEGSSETLLDDSSATNLEKLTLG